jgi:hypothetical protein
MDFLKAENGKMGILIAMDVDYMEFWLEYELESLIGVFHDNSVPSAGDLDGMTIHIVSEDDAKSLMTSIANATSTTCCKRYAFEIKEWIKRQSEYIPF